MKVLAACALWAVAASAAAQAPAPSGAQPPEPARAPLNLRLDDAMRSQPRITFGPAAKDADSVLPALGADARRIEPAAAPRPDSRSAPFPKDSERGQ